MISWESKDRAFLADYNKRSLGKLIPYLKACVPKITGKSFEEVALQSERKQGAEDIIELLELAASPIIERKETMEHEDVTVGVV